MSAVHPFPTDAADRLRAMFGQFTRSLSATTPMDVEVEVKRQLAGYPLCVQHRAARWAVANTEASRETAIRSAVMRAKDEFEPLPPSAA